MTRLRLQAQFGSQILAAGKPGQGFVNRAFRSTMNYVAPEFFRAAIRSPILPIHLAVLVLLDDRPPEQ